MNERVRTVAVVVEQALAAPPAEVYDAWLDPACVRRWFGPGLGETQPVEIDAVVGGAFRIAQVRGGEVIGHAGRYLVLDRPSRLVFTWAVDVTPTAARSRSTSSRARAARPCASRTSSTSAGRTTPTASGTPGPRC